MKYRYVLSFKSAASSSKRRLIRANSTISGLLFSVDAILGGTGSHDADKKVVNAKYTAV